MVNKVKQKLKNGEVSFGSWISLRCTDATELLSNLGFDWLLLDCEHTPINVEGAQELLQAMNGTDCVPLMRVPWNDLVWIKKALDIGIWGLLIPQVNNREEAMKAVSATKYPPVGTRGVGPRRAALYGLKRDEYFARANDDVLVMVQIEHIDGVKNLREICTTKGVDVIFVGPNDLAASQGLIGQPNHPQNLKLIDEIIAVCKELGVPLGTISSGPEEALKLAKQGFQFISIGSDISFMQSAARNAIAKVKGK